ncbi:MAG: hypothetical protein Q7K40_01880 [bacterium]|nr:hypothetical protein [bacterium]
MFNLEQRLDRLFGWVETKWADKCFTWAVRIAYVAAFLMLAVNFGAIIDIWCGIPS